MPTIGFSHKNKMWTSRYSYTSSCMASVNKSFISSPAAPDFNGTQTSPVWSHNKQGKYNSFYGTTHPSMLSASFSQSPSQNKLMKSASLEGSKNLDQCLVKFSAQDDLDSGVANQTTLGKAQEVNGTTYMPVGKNANQQLGKGLQVLGVIDNADVIGAPPVVPSNPEVAVDEGLRAGEEYVSIRVKEGFVNNNLHFDASRPTYYVIFQQVNGVVSAYGLANNPDDPATYFRSITLTENLRYDTAFPSSASPTGTNIPTTATGIPNYNPSTRSFNVFVGTLMSAAVANELNTTVGTNTGGGSWYLGAISHESFTGDFQRGQTAEAALLFPSNLGYFELYAMNLNYEPLALSHDK